MGDALRDEYDSGNGASRLRTEISALRHRPWFAYAMIAVLLLVIVFVPR